MSQFQRMEASLDVPKTVTGIAGFLHAVREVLRYSRVTDIHINTKGEIRYVRYVREGEHPMPIQIDFKSVTPSAVIGSSTLTEVAPSEPDEPAPVAFARLFAAAAADLVAPVAFAVGPRSPLAEWHKRTSGIELRDFAYGVPVLVDEQIPSEALVLLAAYSAGGTLIDVQRCYKLAMPEAPQ